MADQIVEARVVLADGSAITVSKDGHADLYWALRGAGHNFGIVTEVKYRIYDVPNDDAWTHAQMIFSGDKMAELTKVFNTLTEDGEKCLPVELAIWAPILMRIPAVDPVNVSI